MKLATSMSNVQDVCIFTKEVCTYCKPEDNQSTLSIGLPANLQPTSDSLLLVMYENKLLNCKSFQVKAFTYSSMTVCIHCKNWSRFPPHEAWDRVGKFSKIADKNMKIGLLSSGAWSSKWLLPRLQGTGCHGTSIGIEPLPRPDSPTSLCSSSFTNDHTLLENKWIYGAFLMMPKINSFSQELNVSLCTWK